MSIMQRTSDVFTSGIVNVPQNTPALLIFHTDNALDYDKAIHILKNNNIAYTEKSRRNKVTIISNEDVKGYLITEFQKLMPEQIKRKAHHSYPFFELDDKTPANLHYVLAHYATHSLPVYYHETMRGYHFLSAYPLQEEIYADFMQGIKPLNTACPHITIRIRANKWFNELPYFMKGNIQDIGRHEDTVRLKRHLESLYQARNYTEIMLALDALKTKYKIVNYRMNGELGNL